MFVLHEGNTGAYRTLDCSVAIESKLSDGTIHKLVFTPEEWVSMVTEVSRLSSPEVHETIRKIHLRDR